MVELLHYFQNCKWVNDYFIVNYINLDGVNWKCFLTLICNPHMCTAITNTQQKQQDIQQRAALDKGELAIVTNMLKLFYKVTVNTMTTWDADTYIHAIVNLPYNIMKA